MFRGLQFGLQLGLFTFVAPAPSTATRRVAQGEAENRSRPGAKEKEVVVEERFICVPLYRANLTAERPGDGIL